MDTQQLKLFKVLLVGDSCIDKYHYGTCERISPEAPVPVLNHLYTKEYPGMAANVLENLNGLGLPCDFKTNNHFVVKERYVDHKSRQQFLRVDTGEKSYVEPLLLDDVDLENYDVVVISDYEKGYITPYFAKELSRQFSGLIFVDSKKKDLSCFENSIIKINESEKREADQFPENCELIVTRGDQGAQWNNKIYSTRKVDVFDVSGAGDSFLAGLVVDYLLNRDIPKAIGFANWCAEIAVQKSGTYAVTLDDLQNDSFYQEIYNLSKPR